MIQKFTKQSEIVNIKSSKTNFVSGRFQIQNTSIRDKQQSNSVIFKEFRKIPAKG